MFGREYDLCLGIEYVNASLLSEKAHIAAQNTTIQGAIQAILGANAPTRIKVRFGVIEIAPRVPAKEKSVFDTVVPEWKAQRGPLQLVSWLLRIYLVSTFSPQTRGFGGNSPGGEAQDKVGPFSETNQPVRCLLDKIVAQSNGAAWISQIRPGSSGVLQIRAGQPAWEIAEYRGPSTDFAATVNSLALHLR